MPKKGVLSRNSLKYYFDSPGSTERFTQTATRTFGFVRISDRNTLFAFGGGATSFGKTASPLQQFTLGGPFRLSGYSVDEFRGSNSVNGGVGLLYNPKFIPTFLGGKNIWPLGTRRAAYSNDLTKRDIGKAFRAA